MVVCLFSFLPGFSGFVSILKFPHVFGLEQNVQCSQCSCVFQNKSSKKDFELYFKLYFEQTCIYTDHVTYKDVNKTDVTSKGNQIIMWRQHECIHLWVTLDLYFHKKKTNSLQISVGYRWKEGNQIQIICSASASMLTVWYSPLVVNNDSWF